MIAGSLPRGVEPDIYYGELLRELHRLGVTTLIDTEGEPLRQALRAEPHVISPNVLEAEELVGPRVQRRRRPRARRARDGRPGSARGDHDHGPDGCFAAMQVDGSSAMLRARIEERETVAAVGAGDAFLAGFVASRYTGADPENCLRFGVACGAESTQRLGAGLVDPARVERLMGEVEVERIEAHVT